MHPISRDNFSCYLAFRAQLKFRSTPGNLPQNVLTPTPTSTPSGREAGPGGKMQSWAKVTLGSSSLFLQPVLLSATQSAQEIHSLPPRSLLELSSVRRGSVENVKLLECSGLSHPVRSWHRGQNASPCRFFPPLCPLGTSSRSLCGSQKQCHSLGRRGATLAGS